MDHDVRIDDEVALARVVIVNEGPGTANDAFVHGSKMREEAVRQVEDVQRVSRALIDDRCERRIVVGMGSNILTVVLARAVLNAHQRDDEVQVLVRPATCTEANLVVGAPRIIVTLGKASSGWYYIAELLRAKHVSSITGRCSETD
jgi:hypothetical protein